MSFYGYLLQFSLAPSSNSSGGSIFNIGGVRNVTIDQITIVVILVLSMVLIIVGVYNVHKYYLNTTFQGASIQQFMGITYGTLVLLLLAILLAFVFNYSVWVIMFIGWATQLLGFALYRLFNYLQGAPLPKKDVRKAFTVSTAIITIMLMFLV